jgi:LysM repeat protein
MLDPGQGVVNQPPVAPPAAIPTDQVQFNQALDRAQQGPQATPVKQDDQPTRQDLEKEQDGQLEYTVQPNDSLIDIGRRFGRTEEEIKAANPKYFSPYGDPNYINAGQKVVILNDDRAKLAVEMANTRDPEKLQELVSLDLTYTTRGLPTPGDQLKAAQDGLIARRPGDADFAKIVQNQGATLTQLWQAQGRSHEVWDRLLDLASKGDWEGFKAEVGNQLAAAGAMTPTVQAVNDHKTMLLENGPDNPAFDKAVNEAVDKFLVGDPEAAAKQVSDAYQQGGALAASRKLRELTDPQKTNPLSAALIVDKAQSTVYDIAGDFVDPTKSLWHDEPGVGIVGDYGEIFRNMSAVADSIHRSPEGRDDVESMARVFAAWPAMIDAKGAAAEGHTVLSLAVAKDLLVERDEPEKASKVTNDVTAGVEELKTRLRGSVLELGETAAPLLDPASNWSPFLEDANGPAGQPFKTPQEFWDEWLKANPDVIKDVNADIMRLNVEGYQLTRALAGIQEYAPQLQGIDNHAALVQAGEMPDPAKDPQLSLALAVSSAGMADGLRQFNLDGMNNGQLVDLGKIVPDMSWPSRMVRNHIQADWKQITGNKPFGLGLSLYGTGTYIWGVRNHATEFAGKVKAEGVGDAIFQEDGWRNLGFLGMYAGGIVIESGQVFAQLAVSRQSGNSLIQSFNSDKFRNFVEHAATGETNKGWGKLFQNHLKWFGWYNVAGTINYAAQGDVPRATALGAAAAGTFVSTSATAIADGTTALAGKEFVSRFPLLGRVLKVGKFGGPIGTVLTLAGSTALYFIDRADKQEIASKTEPFNKDYLIRAGVRPEIAAELANNDEDGLSAGPRLLALADHIGVKPQELLSWLDKQDVAFVRDFVKYGLHPLKPDASGNFVARVGTEEWDSSGGSYKGEVWVYPAPNPRAVSPTDPDVWNRASAVEARSLEGARIWAQASGHSLMS